MAHWPQHNLLRLPGKLSSVLSAHVYAGSSPLSPLTPLILFLNPLLGDSKTWLEVIHSFRSLCPDAWMIRYDRYGQGESGPDPAHPSGYNDPEQAVQDLAALLRDIVGNETNVDQEAEVEHEVEDIPLVLVGNAFGCALARLYAGRYKGVRGVLFLDHYLTDTLPVALLPAYEVGEEETMTRTREGMRKHLSEGVVLGGMRREGIPRMLPRADGPPLPDWPYVTVGMHDPLPFAEEECQRYIGMDPSITLRYVQPHWESYHRALLKLTLPEKARGPIVVLGAAHNIQAERPEWVVGELRKMVGRIMRVGMVDGHPN
ncbi:hypothetical protein DACRYDRAFT_102372 [Dacryopinax primogenitus]|uniref:AB hydrolase-1 domain-containing protein n=1 Tax=Dacryopinax primogenitus (strain DJM 731) TaxID=1858805 RepID=M5G1U2_DACPD|nr:uncharacterized protein DACRYDRAFT_102372 [Dacryopinax primogenitus]EJT97702.1 hypothetical protein DACRYDRAFT_102372 [Dacryopinax primogenitus]